MKIKKALKVLICTTLCCLLFVSCRHAGQYVDDIKRYTDDVLDGKVKLKPPKHLSIPKDCPYCEEGYYWYNGYKMECNFCDGKGRTMERLY